MGITPDIVEACKKGKREYQEKLYRILSPVLFPVCLRYASDRKEAEDWMQETWIRIFGKIADYRMEGSFEGWTRKICVSVCLENIRKKKILYDQTDLSKITVLSDDEDVFSKLSVQDIITLIQNLSPGYRTVFNLYVMESFSHEEIAIKLGISVGTSKSQLARARQILQEKITRLNKAAKPNTALL